MNDKKTKNTAQQKKHVFQVHTMQSDNKLKITNQDDSKIASSAKDNKLSKMHQNQAVSKKQEASNNFKQSTNPFLTEDVSETTQNSKKGLFAPQKQDKTIEKINQTPADIAPQKKKIKNGSPTNQKKIVHIIMMIFIILFLIGIVGFGIYMLKFNIHRTVDNVNIPSDTIKDDVQINDNTDDANTDNLSSDESIKSKELAEQMYAIDLPNYLSIDVESENVKQDIDTELKIIAQNMQKQDIKKPVSFIVTDKNSNPLSFNVFAISAGMNVPQDIGASLEESFEIYAYNDELKGVRFGFVIDIKDIQSFQTAVLANETKLPNLFNIILDNLGMSATDVIFKDSSYKTHPIRYYNLNSTETYSIDYTINNKQWVVGTTKDALRAIVDSVNTGTKFSNKETSL